MSATPAASDAPADRIPTALAQRVESLRTALLDVAAAPDLENARTMLEPARQARDDVADPAGDLAPDAWDLLTTYWVSLDEENARGNLTNVKSLARAAERLLATDVAPLVESWSRTRTAVTTGIPRRLDDGATEVPLLVFNAPPGGIGAFDVLVRLPASQATTASATATVGQGEARIDAANGTVRIASFDAQALLGAGSSAGAPLTLGTFTVKSRSGATQIPLEVRAIELVDRSGAHVPTVAPDASLALDASLASAGASSAWGARIALASVAVLGIAAVLAARKWLRA